MKKYIIALLPLFLAFSCSNDTSQNSNTDSTNGDTVKEVIETSESSSTLPSPFRIAAMFKRSGLKYIPGLTNGNEKEASYSTSFACAENMGVYSSDMAYCVLNKQTNEGQQLLKTIRTIGGRINLGKVFEKSNLFDRFNKNVSNEDSLATIIGEIQYETDMQLDANQQNELYGVIFAGAWVESMYLGGQVYRKGGNEKIVQALLEQMAVSTNIIEELKINESKNESITGLIADMQIIQDAINSMPSLKKLKDNPELDFKDISPTKAEIESVITTIEILRKKITNG
jgi:hypothetical protein